MRTNAFFAIHDKSGRENLISRIKEEYPNILYLKVPGDIPLTQQEKICQSVSDIIKNVLSAAENTNYGELEIPIGIVIDHSSGQGKIPHLEWYMSTNKSRNVSIILVAEDIKQIRDIYGDHTANIIVNCLDRIQEDKSIMEISEERDMEIIFSNPVLREAAGIDSIKRTPEQEKAFQIWKSPLLSGILTTEQLMHGIKKRCKQRKKDRNGKHGET